MNINIQYHKRYTQFNDIIVKNKLVHTKELCHTCTYNEITIRDAASGWLNVIPDVPLNFTDFNLADSAAGIHCVQ